MTKQKKHITKLPPERYREECQQTSRKTTVSPAASCHPYSLTGKIFLWKPVLKHTQKILVKMVVSCEGENGRLCRRNLLFIVNIISGSFNFVPHTFITYPNIQ